MTSLPYSLSEALVKSSLEKAPIELVEVKIGSPSTQPIFGEALLSTSMSEVSNTSSTKQQAQIILALGLTEKKQGNHVVSVISTIPTFVSISTISTIVSTMASTMIVETQSQSSIEVLNKGKEIVPFVIDKGKEEEIGIDEDIFIPNWDTSDLTLEEMDTLGELWKKKARQQKLRE